QAVTLPAHEHQCHSLFGIQVAVGLFHRNTLPQVLHLLLETAKLKGWAAFYQFVDFKAKVFSYIDRVVFWKLAHWLAHKYRSTLMRQWCKAPKPNQSKTWVLFGKTNNGKLSGETLYRLVGQGKKQFRWRLPEGNPYLRSEPRNTWTSRFTEVAMAFASV
ncbi:group II intron maturase-specific domain-containing protein, partial [Pseudomonas lactis]